MRSSLTGSSRSGAGAPMASGLKKLRGSFMSVPISYSKRDGRSLSPTVRGTPELGQAAFAGSGRKIDQRKGSR
jgi:hypothetical protein